MYPLCLPRNTFVLHISYLTHHQKYALQLQCIFVTLNATGGGSMTGNTHSANEYERGFRHGYQKAINDFLNGKLCTSISQDIAQLPLEAVTLSPRARNCLLRAGCQCLADVYNLSEHQIATMRNLGTKTAAEIADVLAEYGLHLTHWAKYRTPTL